MTKMSRDEQAERLARVRIVSVDRRCRGPLKEGAREAINALLADGDLEGARALDAASRTPCGYDFNEIVLSELFDGQSHETPCPDCGTVIKWTSPVF